MKLNSWIQTLEGAFLQLQDPSKWKASLRKNGKAEPVGPLQHVAFLMDPSGLIAEFDTEEAQIEILFPQRAVRVNGVTKDGARLILSSRLVGFRLKGVLEAEWKEEGKTVRWRFDAPL